MFYGAETMNNPGNTLLQAARQAASKGQTQQARELLQQAVRQYPDDYRAWLWLAGLTSSAKASLNYIARAEILKPGDPQVQRARAWAERRLNAAPAGHTPATAAQLPAEPARAAKAGPRNATGQQQSRLSHKERAKERSREPISWLVATAAATLMVFLLTAVALFWFISDDLVLAAPFENGVFRQITAGPQNGVRQEPDTNPTGIGGAESMSEGQETVLVPVPPTEAAPTAAATETATASPSPTPDPTATPKSLQPKQVVFSGDGGSAGPRATWTPTPTPSPTPTATPTFAPTATTAADQARIARPPSVGINERWISVNLTTQTLTAYEGNTPVRSTLISSGLPRTPTVTGQFRIYLRYRSQDMDGYRLGFNYYLRDVPYVQYFYGNYGLHGTYWHNNFGRPMSHGCVNLPTPEAEWLFNWASIGTLVYVHY
jgi:lipoprotein-anchoring transpeptidase ErfK/SrfK